MKVFDTALKIVKKLMDNGFSAYIVGGAVRDHVMGIEPHDIDITTSATPTEVMKVFPNSIPTGIEYGTVTVMCEGYQFEVTTFRKDGNYKDGRRPDRVIFGASLEDDLSRRDFTINAMAMDADGKIVDPFGGQKDIQAGVIRCVGDPAERFSEDGLRILRAFRFSAKLGFKIDIKTFEAIADKRENLKRISQERIRDEIVKILLTDNTTPAFTDMYETGVLEIILPEIAALYGVAQKNPHHVYDVFNHTLKAVENTPKDKILRLAALFHDTGKPAVKTNIDGIDRFYNHHVVSSKIANQALKRLRLSNKEIDEILELVYWHDIAFMPTPKNVRKVLNKVKYTSLESLLAIKRADIIAQSPKYLDRLAELDKIEEMAREEKRMTAKDLVVNGYDMLALGLKGKEIGETLNFLLNMVIEDPAKNERTILLESANQLLKSRA